MVNDISHNQVCKCVNNLTDNKHCCNRPGSHTNLIRIEVCKLSYQCGHRIQCELSRSVSEVILHAHYFLNAEFVLS